MVFLFCLIEEKETIANLESENMKVSSSNWLIEEEKGNVSCLLAFQSSADHTLIFREMSKGLVFILTNEIQSAHTFLRDSWEMCFFFLFF